MGNPSLVLKWDRSQLYSLREQGLERAIRTALKKAGGDAIRKIRTESGRNVRARKRVKASRVRDAFSLSFPRSSDVRDLRWALNVKRIALPLGDYPARQVQRGVSVAINKGGKRAMITSAFVATMKSGHKGVFLRKGKKRLPIEELYSSTVIDVMKDNGLSPRILQAGSAVFSSSYARLLPIEIDKLKSRIAARSFMPSI